MLHAAGHPLIWPSILKGGISKGGPFSLPSEDCTLVPFSKQQTGGAAPLHCRKFSVFSQPQEVYAVTRGGVSIDV